MNLQSSVVQARVHYGETLLSRLGAVTSCDRPSKGPRPRRSDLKPQSERMLPRRSSTRNPHPADSANTSLDLLLLGKTESSRTTS